MTCSSEGVMPTPKALKDAWEQARSLTEEGDPEEAIKMMRTVWDEHGKNADDHRTWTIVANAEAKIAGESTRPSDYRKSIKHYEKALDKGEQEEVRRQMNKVRAEMDERGIGMAYSIVDDGSPTVYGVFALFVVGMSYLFRFATSMEALIIAFLLQMKMIQILHLLETLLN